MTEDLKHEAMEVTVTAVEKYSDSYETAARMVKDNLDKKFGAPFNVIIGEAYSFCVTYQEKSMLLMYTNGNVAALIWRTVTSFG
jgi:dynein light chain 4